MFDRYFKGLSSILADTFNIELTREELLLRLSQQHYSMMIFSYYNRYTFELIKIKIKVKIKL